VIRTRVEASLRAVAASFAAVGLVAPGAPGGSVDDPPASAGIELRWGLLFAALDRRGDDRFVEAVELIYEGYLLHYRSDRLGLVDEGDRQTALLAGDVFYARGLDLIAARGDVGSVALLTRLMSACSCLRSLHAPFSDDDALWAYTTAGLAALRVGAPAASVGAFFDDLDAALAGGAPADVSRRAASAAAALVLPDPAPLDAAFVALTLAAASAPADGPVVPSPQR